MKGWYDFYHAPLVHNDDAAKNNGRAVQAAAE
jgi:hypothetical protein